MQGAITVKELSAFDAWASKALTENDRQALAVYLAFNPMAGDVIPGTGGIRKVRWARPGAGKSGGYRVIYYFHSDALPIYLITGYAKNTQANLSAREVALFRKLVDSIKREARAKRR